MVKIIDDWRAIQNMLFRLKTNCYCERLKVGFGIYHFDISLQFHTKWFVYGECLYQGHGRNICPTAHDDVMSWHRVFNHYILRLVDSTHKGLVMRSFWFSVLLAWTAWEAMALMWCRRNVSMVAGLCESTFMAFQCYTANIEKSGFVALVDSTWSIV